MPQCARVAVDNPHRDRNATQCGGRDVAAPWTAVPPTAAPGDLRACHLPGGPGRGHGPAAGFIRPLTVHLQPPDLREHRRFGSGAGPRKGTEHGERRPLTKPRAMMCLVDRAGLPIRHGGCSDDRGRTSPRPPPPPPGGGPGPRERGGRPVPAATPEHGGRIAVVNAQHITKALSGFVPDGARENGPRRRTSRPKGPARPLLRCPGESRRPAGFTQAARPDTLCASQGPAIISQVGRGVPGGHARNRRAPDTDHRHSPPNGPSRHPPNGRDRQSITRWHSANPLQKSGRQGDNCADRGRAHDRHDVAPI